jgi:hypothetical protein
VAVPEPSQLPTTIFSPSLFLPYLITRNKKQPIYLKNLMLNNYSKYKYFVLISTGLELISLVFLLGEPAASQEFPRFCNGLEIKSLSRIPPLMPESRHSRPEITVSGSMSPVTAIPRTKKVVLVLTGPVFGSMDSPELKNSLVCTKTGFKVTTAVIRGAHFNGAVRNNTLWQPQTEVIFEYSKRKVVVEATWQIVLDTGLEVSQDLHIPQQVFPVTIQKIIL